MARPTYDHPAKFSVSTVFGSLTQRNLAEQHNRVKISRLARPKHMDSTSENLSKSLKLSKIPIGRTIIHKQYHI
jgi:hypothetical protein